MIPHEPKPRSQHLLLLGNVRVDDARRIRHHSLDLLKHFIGSHCKSKSKTTFSIHKSSIPIPRQSQPMMTFLESFQAEIFSRQASSTELFTRNFSVCFCRQNESSFYGACNSWSGTTSIELLLMLILCPFTNNAFIHPENVLGFDVLGAQHRDLLLVTELELLVNN